MKKIGLMLIVTVISMYSGKIFAWNDEFTHRSLTGFAIRSSKVGDYLRDYLGMHQGIETTIGNEVLAELIKKGSQAEDEPLCRASNHFHTPHRDWKESYMSEMNHGL